MESFSLLKYWRGSAAATTAAPAELALNSTATGGTTTIVTAVAHNPSADTDDEGDGDDGPFFDLEFAVPDEDEPHREEATDCVNESEDENEDGNEDGNEDENGDSEGEREFNFTLSSDSTTDHADANLTFSPSDDLFFKGKLVPVEASLNGGSESEPNSRPQLHVTLLKSAAKFRVFMSGLKKSKSNGERKTEQDGSDGAPAKEETPETQPEKTQQPEKTPQPPKNKFFAVKFKVEEVPIMSLFTRDHSSRTTGTTNKHQKQSSDESTPEENRFSKDVMQRYLKMVKPLYIRVSRRYGEKFRLSGQLILGAGGTKSAPETETVEAPATNGKSLNVPAKLRVVCKHLGKSRSASSAVAAAPPGPAPSRRDDSLLQQQDGIQGAILHCKRSFNASRDSESSLLSRSASDTLRKKP